MPKGVPRRRDTERTLVDGMDGTEADDAVDLSAVPKRVSDTKFPPRKRGEAWKIGIEDLILFRGLDVVGLDDVPDPGYMGPSDSEVATAISKEKIEFKATAYFTKQQWPYFQHLANEHNSGRKSKTHPFAAGSLKIRGVLRAHLYLVPASQDHLTLESTQFWRYRVNTMAPESLKRSLATFERFRILDFMTTCRNRDVRVTHPDASPKDKIRPKQRSVPWLVKQMHNPLRVKFLEKTPLGRHNIEEQLRTHASWIARYLKPMRPNIYNRYFNVPIRQWQELAGRKASTDTLTSATYTQDGESEEEEEYTPRKSASARKSERKREPIVIEIDDSDEEEPVSREFTPQKRVRIEPQREESEDDEMSGEVLTRPTYTRACKAPQVAKPAVLVSDDDDDDDDERPVAEPAQEEMKEETAEPGFYVEVPSLREVYGLPNKPTPRKRTRTESDSDEEELASVTPKRPRKIATKSPRFSQPTSIMTDAELNPPTQDEAMRPLDDDDEIVEISQADFDGLRFTEVEKVTDEEKPMYIWDMLEKNPKLQAAVPEDFRYPPMISDDYVWECPKWTCTFGVDLDEPSKEVLSLLSAADYLTLQPGYTGKAPDRARIANSLVHEHYLQHVPGLRTLLSQASA